jgi:hypothetical protein
MGIAMVLRGGGGDPTITGTNGATGYEPTADYIKQYIYNEDMGASGSDSLTGTWTDSTSTYCIVAYKAASATATISPMYYPRKVFFEV